MPFISGLESNKLYVLESLRFCALGGIYKGIYDKITAAGQLGFQIREAEEIIEEYTRDDTTAVAVCKLINNPWDTIFQRQKIVEYLKNMCILHLLKNPEPVTFLEELFPDTPQELGCINYLLKNILCNSGLPINNKKWLFNSELIAMFYQELGILSKEHPASSFVPLDFLGYDNAGCPNVTDQPVYVNNNHVQAVTCSSSKYIRVIE